MRWQHEKASTYFCLYLITFSGEIASLYTTRFDAQLWLQVGNNRVF